MLEFEYENDIWDYREQLYRRYKQLHGYYIEKCTEKTCHSCDQIFVSRNQLHQHLRQHEQHQCEFGHCKYYE